MLDTVAGEGRSIGRAAGGVGVVKCDCVRNLSAVPACLQLKLTTQASHASVYRIIELWTPWEGTASWTGAEYNHVKYANK